MFLEYFISISVAALVGGLIGIEREYRDKSAGFRTMILIAIGSALFTILSKIIGEDYGDVTRIASAIVSGVGFLGAGVILKDGPTVRGLTTAASIWLVASLGMGAGAEQYELVFAVVGVVLVVLWLLPPFERWIDRLHEFIEFHITIKNTNKAEEKILDLFAEGDVKIVKVRRTRITKGERILHIRVKTNSAKLDALSSVLMTEKSILALQE